MKKQSKIPALILASIFLLGMASAQEVNIEPGNIDPETVTSDTNSSSQEFNVVVNNLSTDDEVDYIYFEFPDFLEDSVEPNEVDTNVTISNETNVTDFDEDGINETVVTGLNPESEEFLDEDENMSNTASANVTLDADVDYSDLFEEFNMTVHAMDSENGENSTNLTVYREGINDTENTSNETENDEFNFTDEDNTTVENDGLNFSDNQTNPDSQQDGGILRGLFNALANLFSPQDSANSTPEDQPGDSPQNSPDDTPGV